MSKTILVVDDEIDLLSLLQEILEMEGYEVFSAKNAAEAISIWEKQRKRIHILLTDICISKVDTGMALANKLLADKSELQVVYSSGYSYETVVSRYAMPVDASFLQKPFQFEALFKTLKNCDETVSAI